MIVAGRPGRIDNQGVVRAIRQKSTGPEKRVNWTQSTSIGAFGIAVMALVFVVVWP